MSKEFDEAPCSVPAICRCRSAWSMDGRAPSSRSRSASSYSSCCLMRGGLRHASWSAGTCSPRCISCLPTSMMLRCDVGHIRRSAVMQDDGRFLLLLLTALGAAGESCARSYSNRNRIRWFVRPKPAQIQEIRTEVEVIQIRSLSSNQVIAAKRFSAR